MSAASLPEWLAAGAVGTVLFVPGALLILGLDHDLSPRLPHVDVASAVAAADRAVQRVRLQLAAWLLVLAWHLESGEAAR
ncbi:hypothetical protein AB0K66_26975 [Streptomyces werraensis]|uniref:hypothetical protein n=1 Tax=Streptomyces werraensis TaxID=68284 RepID=UPI00343967D7